MTGMNGILCIFGETHACDHVSPASFGLPCLYFSSRGEKVFLFHFLLYSFHFVLIGCHVFQILRPSRIMLQKSTISKMSPFSTVSKRVGEKQEDPITRDL